MYPQYATQPPDMIALLHEQHRAYTTELGSTHQSLSKLYKKLAKVERVLAEREERQLSRNKKKKVQWTRTVTKSQVDKVLQQQCILHEHLRQCADLIASYGAAGQHFLMSPMTPYPAHFPRTPYAQPFEEYSPIASNPWMPHATAAATARSFSLPQPQQERSRPQYWDLSMLREPSRRRSSPHASADSGFYEPPMYAHPFHLAETAYDDPNHVYAHELMSPSSNYSTSPTNAEAEPFTPATTIAESFVESEVEARDDVGPLSPKGVGGLEQKVEKGHKRRYSEDAIRIIENRLSSSGAGAQGRGSSVGPVPGRAREKSVALEAVAGQQGDGKMDVE